MTFAVFDVLVSSHYISFVVTSLGTHIHIYVMLCQTQRVSQLSTICAFILHTVVVIISIKCTCAQADFLIH